MHLECIAFKVFMRKECLANTNNYVDKIYHQY